MIAVRLLDRAEVTDRLKEFACELLEEFDNPTDRFYQASYWRTSWGFHFVVPEVGEDRRCPEYRLYEVLAELSREAAKAQR